MRKVFRYLKYYFELNSKALHAEAFAAAKKYYASRPLRNVHNPYPTPSAYNFRREEFQAWQRGYINRRRSDYAKAKMTAYQQTITS